MKIFWNTQSPRVRGLSVFMAVFFLTQIGFGAQLKMLYVLFGIYTSAFVVYFLARWGFFAKRISMTLPNHKETIYEKLRKNPGKARTAPSEPVEFIDPDEADEELFDDDRVIGVYHAGEAAAYPLAALGVREISNEEYGTTPIVITWSPVTYSARAFIANVNNEILNFGRHTHTIYNSPVMPEKSNSEFIQFTGQAVTGHHAGNQMRQIPVLTTTWIAWKEAHPNTEIMSTEGGPETDIFERYYANDRNGVHSLNPIDKRLHGKDVVLGLNIKGDAKAFSFTRLIETPLIQENLGSEPVLVLYERASSTAVAFSPMVNGQILKFKGKTKNPHRRSAEVTASGEGERPNYEAWMIEDQQTGSTWRAITGECIEGQFKGNRLAMLEGMTSFWFAWSRFYPDAELLHMAPNESQ